MALGDMTRSLIAVKLLTKIRMENPALWESIMEFAREQRDHEFLMECGMEVPSAQNLHEA